MAWGNKVVWSEGLFLRPQHFQQFDRHVAHLVHDRATALRGYGWGFTEVRLNREMLALGRVAVQSARGVFEDGTTFSIPEDADPPPPFEPPANLRDARLHLALPLWQPGAVETDARGVPDVPVRYGVAEQEFVDSNAGERESAAVEVARLRLQILPEDAERTGHACLPIARLVEVRADRQVILDEAHIPPVLSCSASPILRDMITEVRGLLRHRAEALAARATQAGRQGVAEIADLLLLQLANRYEPVFAHLASAATVHPETLYGLLAQLAGELATYARADRRPPEFGAYRHEDLSGSFRPVIGSVRQSLNAVLEQTAIQVPLREHRYGIQLAEVHDRTLFQAASFVLAVRADVEMDRLRREVPSQIKIGPAEKIKELVNVALTGIRITPLPVAPRQIPFHAGVTYFEMDRQSPFWRELQYSGGLTLHVSGDFPNLEMALWAIRGQ